MFALIFSTQRDWQKVITTINKPKCMEKFSKGDRTSHISGFYIDMEVVDVVNDGKSVVCKFPGGEGTFPVSSLKLVEKADETGKKKVYLSGPISGVDMEECRRNFENVKKFLEFSGFLCVCPLENGLPYNSPTREHLRRDIELLMGCDAIYMMERWCHSAGCVLEFQVATAIGLEVMFQETAVNPFKFK